MDLVIWLILLFTTLLDYRNEIISEHINSSGLKKNINKTNSESSREHSERNKLLRTIDRVLDPPMIFLGFVWLVLLGVELIWGLSKPLEYLSITIWIIFLIDFLVKLVLATSKISYLKKNWLTALSLIVPPLRLIRIVRIVRVIRGLKGIRLIRMISSMNRSMKSLAATMRRRGFAYVMLLTLLVSFGGAAGMYGMEKGNPGFSNYWESLYWTGMRVITSGNEAWPITPEGRGLAFILALFGYAIFGYVTATLATFFIGRDVEEKDAPAVGKKEVEELKKEIIALQSLLQQSKK
jgi:voltage-gated potassium channel